MKKEIYIPLLIVVLTLAFGVICLMVYLSDGKAYWIKKKLKIGALLLTFSFFAESCETTSCYLPPMPGNSIRIDNSGDSLIYSFKDTMFVKISNLTYPFFSYDIMDDSFNSIKSDLLQKENDSTNYNNFYFLIFENDFEPGKYKINFYGESDELVTLKNKIDTFEFLIK